MSDQRPVLSLAHSPDPDDAFMWWPVTGKVDPRSHEPVSAPVIDTGRFRFRAVPGDIETLNRRAAQSSGAGSMPLYDVTALSARAYADAAGSYHLTACGGSFGDGYGPKVVVRRDSRLRCDGCLRGQKPVIAVPGARTTAFLVLSLVLGEPFRFIELPFDRIIDAVAAGEAGAGLVIHEGQLTFADAGLREILDVGEWWKGRTGLPLPLGVNAVRRDLDARFGAGSLADVAATLRRSVAHARSSAAESLEYAAGFALANVGSNGMARERVERFVAMYVNDLTLDMGDLGRQAIRRLLDEGARAGLCPPAPSIEVV